ncbi:MAG: TldD/PmbA family protein [Bacteroidales bacterium]
MIAKEHKDIARWAMEFAQKNGAQTCKVSIYSGASSSFEILNEKLDKLQQASENKMVINLYVDGRFGSISTNRINKAELESFIKNGIESVRYLAEDPCRVLPDPSILFKGEGADLKQYDSKYEMLQPEEKIALAKAAVEEIYKTDERIISVSGGYGDGFEDAYMITSNGFEGEESSTSYGVSVQVSLKGEGDARPEDYWFDSSIGWDGLQKAGIGKEALRRCLRKLGQQKIKSGNYPMLIEGRMLGRLFSPILQALNGSSLQQRNSFLIDKLDQKLFSDKLTVVDDPHIPGAFGARWFDGEGVSTQKRSVIEAGVLKTYFIDTYNSKKMNVPQTISGPSTLTFAPGTKNFDELLAGMKRGVYVTGFNGGNSNPTSGDYSFGIEGFWVENGELTKPISEMNITGNLIQLFTDITEVGNDPYLRSSMQSPTILFGSVDFSGL